MANEKVLIHLDDVKMHFPLKKESIFQKEQLFVKAVDGISLDIYEGETLGLVGESGCGKSTLGRVILQLYTQTAGKVHYNGVSLDDYVPAYAHTVAKGIVNAKGNVETLKEKYSDAVHMAGGSMLTDDLAALSGAWIEKLHAVKSASAVSEKLAIVEIKLETLKEKSEKTADDETLKNTLEAECKQLSDKYAELEKIVNEKQKALDDIANACKDKPGFEELESLKDHSIDLARLKSEEMRRLRREMQMVFQDPYSSLNPRFTVGQAISEALVEHGMYDNKGQLKEDYTLQVMDKCGLQKYMLHRYPHQFSGGQRQRIGIARALALKPKFVVCDEAVSALDVSIQSQIINLLMELKNKDHLTYLFISHDLSAVKFISDRVGVMYLGNLVELSDSEEIFQTPLHPYTNALLDAIPTCEEESNKELQVIEGDIPSPINPPTGCKFHTRCKYCQDKCKTELPEFREIMPGHFVACHYPVTEKRN